MVSKSFLPAAVTDQVRRLGEALALARKRRRLSQQVLAQKAGLTRVTLRKVERGQPTTEAGAYFSVLWALGLEHTADRVAHPDDDDVGKTLERARLPLRARAASGKLDDDF